MRVASVTEAKNRLSALLDEVRAGESILIVDRGIPVAWLESAAERPDDDDGRLARLARSGAVRPARGAFALELLAHPAPRPSAGASVVDALLEERRAGR